MFGVRAVHGTREGVRGVCLLCVVVSQNASPFFFRLVGEVNQISKEHIGLLVFGVFNAVIPRTAIPDLYKFTALPKQPEVKEEENDEEEEKEETPQDTSAEEHCFKSPFHTIKVGTMVQFTVRR